MIKHLQPVYKKNVIKEWDKINFCDCDKANFPRTTFILYRNILQWHRVDNSLSSSGGSEKNLRVQCFWQYTLSVVRRPIETTLFIVRWWQTENVEPSASSQDHRHSKKIYLHAITETIFFFLQWSGRWEGVLTSSFSTTGSGSGSGWRSGSGAGSGTPSSSRCLLSLLSLLRLSASVSSVGPFVSIVSDSPASSLI